MEELQNPSAPKNCLQQINLELHLKLTFLSDIINHRYGKQRNYVKHFYKCLCKLYQKKRSLAKYASFVEL